MWNISSAHFLYPSSSWSNKQTSVCFRMFQTLKKTSGYECENNRLSWTTSTGKLQILEAYFDYIPRRFHWRSLSQFITIIRCNLPQVRREPHILRLPWQHPFYGGFTKNRCNKSRSRASEKRKVSCTKPWRTRRFLNSDIWSVSKGNFNVCICNRGFLHFPWSELARASKKLKENSPCRGNKKRRTFLMINSWRNSKRKS